MTRLQRIKTQLTQALTPTHLEIIDESINHHVPENAETHFKVVIVSDEFSEMSRLQRHRKINDNLKEEFSLGLHALAIHAFTSEEWQSKKKTSQDSPKCRGGFKENDL